MAASRRTSRATVNGVCNTTDVSATGVSSAYVGNVTSSATANAGGTSQVAIKASSRAPRSLHGTPRNAVPRGSLCASVFSSSQLQASWVSPALSSLPANAPTLLCDCPVAAHDKQIK